MRGPRRHRAGLAPRLLAGLAAPLLAASLAVGCQEPGPPDSTLFERAEERMHAGDYEGARQNYTRFLEAQPTGPFSDLARQRLLNIEREMDSVMGRRATPAPIYIRPPEPREAESAE